MGNEKGYFDYCKSLNLSDNDSVVLAKYCTSLMERIDKKDEWSRERYLSHACRELVNSANTTNQEKMILDSQLRYLKEHRMPLIHRKL